MVIQKKMPFSHKLMEIGKKGRIYHGEHRVIHGEQGGRKVKSKW